MKGTLNPVLHELAAALRFVGLRDRLRCPQCGSVGTWKPHGQRWDREDLRRVRRWMCKWCGLYVGPEGRLHAKSDPAVGAWQLDKDAGPDAATPADVVAASGISGTWPWRG